ncbi:uncharacterized protein LOC122112886 [Dipodomys spectabilis]|uniref:uncharacterized protein LOC122112886 n=1 Tax=Dipodomys spectabilis TaxID=105255 RepID=UPI001C534DF8|nr:uncharacterized protein LOC122112886 [Dipodomys spectabilis]
MEGLSCIPCTFRWQCSLYLPLLEVEGHLGFSTYVLRSSSLNLQFALFEDYLNLRYLYDDRMIRSFCRSVYYWFVFIRRHNRVVHATTDTRTYPETEKTDDNILTEVVISSNENDITCPEKTEPQEIISKHVNKSDTDLLDIVISSGNNTTNGDSDTVLAVVNNTTGLDENNAGDLILEDVDERDSDTVLAVVNNTTGLDENNAGDLILEDVDERDIETMPAVVIISGNNTTTGDSDTVLAVVNNTTGDSDTVLAVVNNTTGLEDTKTGDLILEDISDSDTDTVPDIVIGSDNFMTTGTLLLYKANHHIGWEFCFSKLFLFTT